VLPGCRDGACGFFVEFAALDVEVGEDAVSRRGSHQTAWPKSFIAAGTRVMRMM